MLNHQFQIVQYNRDESISLVCICLTLLFFWLIIDQIAADKHVNQLAAVFRGDNMHPFFGFALVLCAVGKDVELANELQSLLKHHVFALYSMLANGFKILPDILI